MAQHNELGKRGEDLALAELQNKGYTILDRNWRFRKAEIDIIARKDAFLVAIEVKTRSSTTFGNPQDFVSHQKIKRLVTAMDHYVKSRDLELEVRFDIIAIVQHQTGYKLEHLEDAFYFF